MGIFDLPTGGPTPVGGMGAEVAGPTGGIGEMLMKGFGANANTLTMMGLGLLSARTAEQQRQAVMSGYLYGGARDDADRKEKREEEEKKRKEAKTAAFQSAMAGLYPQYRDAIMSGDTESATALIRMAQDKAYKDQSAGFERERIDLARREAERAENRPIPADSPLVDPKTFKPVYVPPAPDKGPVIVPDGASLVNRDGSTVPIQGRDPNAVSQGVIKNETDLRKEFEARTKTFKEVDGAHSRIIALAGKPPSGQNDAGILYGYIKMLDPLGAVREGDIATVQAASIPEQLKSAYIRALQGEKMSPAIRDQFVQSAQTLYESSAAAHEKERQEFGSLARRYKVDPDSVIGSFERRPPPKAPLSETTAKSTPPADNPYVQEAIKRSESNPELRKSLIKMGVIPPDGPKPPATAMFRR